MEQINSNLDVVDLDTDVLIIGSGPTGSTAALALAKLGIKTTVISRWNWLANSPRAHITNQRTMEVFRELGIEPECLKYATDWDLMGDSLVTTSLAGEELLRIRAWGTDPKRKGDFLAGSPCDYLDIPQPYIEPILVNNAQAQGAHFYFNTEYLNHIQTEEYVISEVENRDTGKKYKIKSKFLIGADGAKSKVFDDLNLKLEGHTARAGTHYTWFNADLSKYVEHRPSILYWICSPDTSFGEIGFGLLRTIRPWHQWIAGWGFDIKKGEPNLSDDEVIERIRIMVGDPKLDVEIINKSVWYVNQAYAPIYSKGRVFCGGDAVHRHPPSSGLGLNTCVQDAFNLAWKIAYTIKGYADVSLLNSYTAERAPVGKQIVERANQSRLDYAPLQDVFRVKDSENPIKDGIKRFRDPGAEGQKARKDAANALKIKEYEFSAQGVEMNQRYNSNAIISEKEPEQWLNDKELFLQATTRPGAKIPHAWLVNEKGKKVSTLDIVGQGKFTLITGISGQKWIVAVNKLNLEYLRSITIGSLECQDPYYEWYKLREIEEDGALLVRPDGFIAWRQKKLPNMKQEQIDDFLKKVIAQILT